MENNLKEAINSIVWYNGLYEFLQPLKAAIEERDSEHINSVSVIGCDWYEKLLKESDQVQFLWMLLVLMYGDYGTSPRTGWLYMENKDEIIKFIDEIATIDDRFMWEEQD